MIVSTFQYKRPAGIVGQLNLSKVRSFGDRELAIIGAWVKDLTEGSEAKSEDLKSSNYEFQQYLTVFSILEEVALCDTPCPCAVVAVVMALSKSAHPSKEDMQLLHKRTSEQILEVLTEQASE